MTAPHLNILVLSDRPWVLEGAAVHVSIVGFDGGREHSRLLDGVLASSINADLTGDHDLTLARRLREDVGLAFMADTKGGPFDIPGDLARKMIAAPPNPNGRPNSDVVIPWVNSLDVARRPRDMWIIDFGTMMPESGAARAETVTWMFAALNTVEPPIQHLLEMDLLHTGEPWVAMRRPAVVETVQARLAPLAARLDGRDYLLGRFTAADVLMATVLRFLRHTDLPAGFPVLEAYLDRCEARPAFQRALYRQLGDYAHHAPVAA